ncbi:MAG: MFS transporter [Deltaproteobacteria bacterium]|nr:MFS transporter [Deltaproteobacteria bacterium]
MKAGKRGKHRWVTPLVVKKLGRFPTLVLIFLAFALGHGIVASIRSQFGAGVGYIGINIAMGIAYPAFVVFTMEIVAREWRSVMAGCNATAWGFGTSVFLFGGGHIAAAYGYRSIFAIAMAMALLCAVIFFLRKKIEKTLDSGSLFCIILTKSIGKDKYLSVISATEEIKRFIVYDC